MFSALRLGWRRETQSPLHVGCENLVHRIGCLCERICLILTLGNKLRKVAASHHETTFFRRCKPYCIPEPFHIHLVTNRTQTKQALYYLGKNFSIFEHAVQYIASAIATRCETVKEIPMVEEPG
ncbi:MAG: hypothetical protein WC681_24520 [Sterolibacterium sp.]